MYIFFVQMKLYFVDNINKGMLCRTVFSKAILRFREYVLFINKRFQSLIHKFLKNTIKDKSEIGLSLLGSDSSSFLNTGNIFACLSFER